MITPEQIRTAANLLLDNGMSGMEFLLEVGEYIDGKHCVLCGEPELHYKDPNHRRMDILPCYQCGDIMCREWPTERKE
jgi:hypothetical protein